MTRRSSPFAMVPINANFNRCVPLFFSLDSRAFYQIGMKVSSNISDVHCSPRGGVPTIHPHVEADKVAKRSKMAIGQTITYDDPFKRH